MDQQELSLAILFGFVLVGFVYLGWTHRTDDAEEYHTVHRKAGLARILASCFTVVGASEFVVFATLTYIFGVYSLLFFAGTFFGFLALSLLASRIRDKGSELDEHSIPDFAAVSHFPILSSALTVMSVVFTSCLVLIQLIIGGTLIASMTGESYQITTGLLAVAVFGYLYFGGYRALLFTDIVQGIILFAFTVLMAYFLANMGSGVDYANISFTISIMDAWGDYAILFVGGFFAIFGGPEIWQRVLTANTDKTASRGLSATAFVMFAWGLALVIASVGIRQLMPEANPDNVFFDFLGSGLPDWMLGIIVVLMLAAIVSTADTELFASAVVAHKELNRFRNQKDLRIFDTRILLALLLVAIVFLALVFSDVLSIYFGLVYITFITGPFALALVLNKGTKWVFRGSLLIAVCIYAYIFANNLLISWYPVLILLASIPPLFVSRDKQQD